MRLLIINNDRLHNFWGGKMKKVLSIILSSFIAIFVLSACGNASGSHRVAGYNVYSVKVKSIKENKEDHEFDVTGETNAPDGAKIYAATPDSNYVTYGSNAASAGDLTTWAKVKDGKFKVTVDPNDLYYGKYKTGQKVQAVIFAIDGFDQDVESNYQFSKSQMKQIKEISEITTFTITYEIRDYLNKIYEKTAKENPDSSDTDDSSSSDSSSSSSSNNTDDLSSYSTGITYDQLARTPNQFKKKKIMFTGEVAQVIDQKGVTELRLAVDGDYDNILLVDILDKSLKGSRVLENDLVTVYGFSDGIANYTSTTNEPISIPSMIAVSLDDKGTASDDYGD